MRKAIIYGNGKIFLMKEAADYRLPVYEEVEISKDNTVFSFDDYIAVSAEIIKPPHCFEGIGLRESWKVLSTEDYAAVAKGAELLNWDSEQKFCPADGKRLERASEISKKCPECGKEYFPLLYPAIVVLVLRNDEALLVHARTLKNPVLTLVAGFVETGESLEECVKREIKEETSLEVDQVKYYGSQSWPFPHQLMIGFTARYKGGELCFADGEITEGGFFTKDNVPLLPTLPSLSRMIIDDWINGKLSSGN